MRPDRFTSNAAMAALLLAALLAAGTLGCATVDRMEHGYRAKEFAGAPLSPDRGRGKLRFRAELQYDPTLAAYVREHGRPDFFYIVDHQKLYVFYVRGDRAAMFERVVVEASEVTELGRIPGSMLAMLPPKVKQQIVSQRASSQRRAQKSAKRDRARIARTPSRAAPPAAKSPGGVYIGGFEIDEIIARMRAPLTAADPGIGSWRKARLRSGKTVYSAQVGGTRYEVRDERIAFTVALPSSRTRLPPSARQAIQRVNDAIFAHRASAVTQTMMALAVQAASDRSGRTSFTKRVAGRTVHIGRRVGEGVFAYAILP